MSEETNGQANGAVPEVELIIKVRTSCDVIPAVQCCVAASVGRVGTTAMYTGHYLGIAAAVKETLCAVFPVCRDRCLHGVWRKLLFRGAETQASLP